MLPAARLLDGALSPYSGSAVEIEETSRPVSRRMFDDQVAVEEDRLNPRQQGIGAIEVAPAHLYHPDAWVGKVVDALFKDLGRWHEIGIEDQEKFATGPF